MSRVTNQTESVDQIWSQYASKVLKSGCVQDNHLTLEQLRNWRKALENKDYRVNGEILRANLEVSPSKARPCSKKAFQRRER